MVGHHVLEAQMKSNKIFSIVLGVLLLSPACVMAQHKPSSRIGWKTYEAANGQIIKVNMATVWHSGILTYVTAEIVNVDVVPQPMFFHCDHHPLYFMYNSSSEWQYAPPRSIAGLIGRDVCVKR